MAEIREVWQKLGELSATLGIMDSAISHFPEYEQVREGWEERLDQIIEWADSQIQEVTGFGEHYDED